VTTVIILVCAKVNAAREWDKYRECSSLPDVEECVLTEALLSHFSDAHVLLLSRRSPAELNTFLSLWRGADLSSNPLDGIVRMPVAPAGALFQG